MAVHPTGTTSGRTRRLRFCLVTSAHVCNNPRLVKEADALVGAGHDVHVVAVDANPSLAARDATVMATRRWTLTRVRVQRADPETRRAWAMCALSQAASRALFGAGRRGAWVCDQSLSRFLRPLTRAAIAAASDVDIVVAHNLPALPAAWRAARDAGARLVFDFEDLYDGVLPDLPQHVAEQALVGAVEAAYVRRCDALLASSEGIAAAVERTHGMEPTVVLNAFPLARHGERRTPIDRHGSDPSLYWFSQVLGSDRGLEEALSAAGKLRRPVQVHFRGEVSPDYRSRLLEHAERVGLRGRVHIHAPAAPDELVSLASDHDIGLSPEPPSTRNHQVCVSNKLLTYLVAGVPVAATDTPGQRGVIDQAPGAGFVYTAGDVDGFAAGLAALLATPESLAAAKLAALEAAHRRFSWEVESERLVRTLEALAPAAVQEIPQTTAFVERRRAPREGNESVHVQQGGAA